MKLKLKNAVAISFESLEELGLGKVKIIKFSHNALCLIDIYSNSILFLSELQGNVQILKRIEVKHLICPHFSKNAG